MQQLPNLDQGIFYAFNVLTNNYCSCLNGNSVCSFTTVNAGVNKPETIKSKISNSDLLSIYNFGTLIAPTVNVCQCNE